MFPLPLIILGVLLAVSIAANAFQYKMHESYVIDTAKNIAVLESANKTQSETIKELQRVEKENQNTILSIGNKNRELEFNYREANKNLEQYKEKKSKALENIDITNRAIRLGSKRVFNELSCSTGDVGKCKTDSSTTTNTIK